MTEEERRKTRRRDWLQLPAIKRWDDTLPDLSRLPVINPVFSIPRTLFFSHISAVLHSLYVKSRKVWSADHPLTPYDK
jgi:hypothetical protein